MKQSLVVITVQAMALSAASNVSAQLITAFIKQAS
jgi:hypothetical protein